jgi:hypothetical protein
MTCCIQKIDVTNFARYYKGLGDNGPAKIGHVNYVLSLLSNISSGIGGTNYIYVMANGTPTENATELLTAYTTAQGMSPSATNRMTIVAGPGYYDFGSTYFELDTEYINLVSLDGNRSIIFNSANPSGTILVNANNVYVQGVDVQTKAFNIAELLPNTIIKNCKGGDYSFGFGGTINSTFIDCDGGKFSFASKTTIVAPVGVFENFSNPTAAGIFTNCTAGIQSFGSASFVSASASGTFTNCTGGNNSFGLSFMGGAIASGTFTNCTAGSSSYGTFGTASGTFTNCIGGDFCFGANGTVSGIFTNCTAGNQSWITLGGLTGKLYFSRHSFSQTDPTNALGGNIVAFITSSNNFIAQLP